MMFNKNGVVSGERPVNAARLLMDGKSAPQAQPAAPASPSPPPRATVVLSRPLQTHGGALSALELKEPPARLIMKHGLPFRVLVEDTDAGRRVEFKHDPRLMTAYMIEMTGFDEGVLSTLAAIDVLACWNRITAMLQDLGN